MHAILHPHGIAEKRDRRGGRRLHRDRVSLMEGLDPRSLRCVKITGADSIKNGLAGTVFRVSSAAASLSGFPRIANISVIMDESGRTLRGKPDTEL